MAINTSINRLFNTQDLLIFEVKNHTVFYTADMWDYDYPQINWFMLFDHDENTLYIPDAETCSYYGCMCEEPNIMVPSNSQYQEINVRNFSYYKEENKLDNVEIEINCHFFGDDYQIPDFCNWIRTGGNCLGLSSSLEYYYRIIQVKFDKPQKKDPHHYVMKVTFTCMPYKFLYADCAITGRITDGEVVISRVIGAGSLGRDGKVHVKNPAYSANYCYPTLSLTRISSYSPPTDPTTGLPKPCSFVISSDNKESHMELTLMGPLSDTPQLYVEYLTNEIYKKVHYDFQEDRQAFNIVPTLTENGLNTDILQVELSGDSDVKQLWNGINFMIELNLCII